MDARDSCTCGHSERVAKISFELGRDLGFCDRELGDLYLSALLQDIGKIGIPDSILFKPGSLTEEEFNRMKEHPVIGWKMLSGTGSLERLGDGILSHHERMDGQGYPHGLKDSAIPLQARVSSGHRQADGAEVWLPELVPVPRIVK